MPTDDTPESFRGQFHDLSPGQQQAFLRALERFIADLATGSFRAGLRVKGVRGMPGYFEMTWAPDGRAIFCYGSEAKPGHRHVVWYAVGTHQILP